jgi:prevent-host-death family protein
MTRALSAWHKILRSGALAPLIHDCIPTYDFPLNDLPQDSAPDGVETMRGEHLTLVLCCMEGEVRGELASPLTVVDVATSSYSYRMKTVGVRELKNRLSEYLRLVRRGEEILVTDRGQVVAELRPAGRELMATPYRPLHELARQGRARLGDANRADLYPVLESVAPRGEVARLLDEERGTR